MNMRKLFEMLNRINKTPAISNDKLNSKIGIGESVNALITSHDGHKTKVGSK